MSLVRPTIVHVIRQLTAGGAARCMLTMASGSHASGLYQHRIVSLLPCEPGVVKTAEIAGLEVVSPAEPTLVESALAETDIVQVHFWNTPELYRWLRSELPPMRLLLYAQIGGYHAPHVFTPALVDFADFFLTASTFSEQLLIFRQMSAEERQAKLGMLLTVADLTRVSSSLSSSLSSPSLSSSSCPQPDRFTVGYVGTIGPVKMHPDYMAMSAAIRVPNLRLVVCGAPAFAKKLRQQAEAAGIGERLDFRGYVENIGAVLAEMDVFGYPLCEENYSASDSALEEAMAAGLPAVVFAYGGTQSLVQQNETGLIVQSADEYSRAIEYLYQHPAERKRMGENARRYAQQHFGVGPALAVLHPLYERLLKMPKRTRMLADVPGDADGATLFVASLGERASHFGVSLWGTDREALLAADALVGASSDVLCNDGGGGLFHYRNVYPQDGMLRLWTGLVLMQRGQKVRALSEFQTAAALGCDDWRAWWYVAQVSSQLGAMEVTLTALQGVATAAPDFEEAQQMLVKLQRKRGALE